MTTQDIEQAIRDLIKSLYCVEYQGVLRVYETTYKFPGEEPEHVGYRMDLGLNKDEKPLSIACDGTAEEFLKFIENGSDRRHTTTIMVRETPNSLGILKKTLE